MQDTPSPSRAPIVVLVGAVVGFTLMESLMAPALPLIQRGVGASLASIAWIFTGVLLVGAVSVPVVARLADIRDKRPLFIGVVTIAAVGVLVAALAESVLQLTVGHALQGVGLGLIPLSVAIIRDTQPESRVRSANGLIIGSSALATVAGLLIAGPLLERLHYSWLYWLTLALLAPIALCSWWVLPSCPPVNRDGRLDVPGAVLLAGSLTALLIGVTKAASWGWTSPAFLGLEALAVLGLIAFCVVESRTEHPLVRLRLGGRPVAVVCLVSFVIGYVVSAINIAMPTIVDAPGITGYGLEGDATTAGLLLLPLGIAGLLAAPLTGWLERLLGARGVMALAGIAIAGSCVALFFARQGAAALAVSSGLMGIGIGWGLTQAMNTVATEIPVERVASVTGLAFVLKSVGGTLGGQISASVLAGKPMAELPLPSWSGFTTVFWIATAVGVIAVGLSALLPPAARPATVPAKVADSVA
ncbi:MFS transporter [Streptomyces sp. NPDC004838]